MPDSETSNNEALAKLLPVLMGFAKVAERLAERFKGAVLACAVSGALAAAWLGYFAFGAWHFSPGWALAAGVALAVPSMVSGWCWSVLDDAVGLPRRIADWAGRAKLYADSAKARLQGAKEPGSRFKDLWNLGGLAVELALMGGDARDLMGIVGGTLALANPVFLFALIGSALAIGLLDLCALLAGLFFLF
jgi:hypothetical protein